jgi:GNAT superfamily N-acetyltransferase
MFGDDDPDPSRHSGIAYNDPKESAASGRGGMAILPEGYTLAEEGEVPASALELLDEEFGAGYAWEGFDDLYYDGEALGHFALAEDGSTAGVCLGRYLTRAEVAGWADIVGLPDLAEVRMSTVETLAVHPDHRGRGLGSRLIGSMVDALLEDERLFTGQPSALMANCWLRPSSGSEPLFLRAGFTVRGHVFDFWTERSEMEPWECPVDLIPCHCRASNVIREIEQPRVRTTSDMRLVQRRRERPEHAPVRTMFTRGLTSPGDR